MATVLTIFTISLIVASVLFAFVYLWLNGFSRVTELHTRSTDLLKIIKTSQILSFVVVGMSCLLSSKESVDDCIERASTLYAVIAICWLAVTIAGLVVRLVVSLSRRSYRADASTAIRKMFRLSVTGTVIGMILSWVLS